jgi:hypothetical protein
MPSWASIVGVRSLPAARCLDRVISLLMVLVLVESSLSYLVVLAVAESVQNLYCTVLYCTHGK